MVLAYLAGQPPTSMFPLSHFAGISRFFRTVSSARGGLYSARPAWAALAFGLAAISPLAGAVPYVDPADVLGIWDFNSVAVATQAADLMQGTPMVYQASTAFSADAGGRSGLAGDRAVNFGTVAGNSARIGDAAFMALLNQSNAVHDKLSVVFWQKWSTGIAASSTVWFNSASASGGNRGFQIHLPYGDGTVYFDTSGCCDLATQRLSAGIASVFPSFNWQQWHHFALIKDGGAKQVWVDGQLFMSQTTGAAALPSDMTEVLVGQVLGTAGNSLRGLLDDFAIFGTGLEPTQIAALASGTSPAALVVPPESRPPQFVNLIPAADTRFHPVGGGVGFTATTVAPNTIAASDIRLFLNGADVTAGLVIGGTATNRVVTYSGTLLVGQIYSLRAEATDSAARSSAAVWTFDTADPATTPTQPQLELAALGTARGSTAAAGSSAALAIDGNPATLSETANEPGAFWEIELERTVPASRIYLVAPTAAGYAQTLAGVVVRVYDLRDQLIHESTVGNVALGGTWAILLPPGTEARIVRLELPAGQTNGAGDYRIALAELKVFGDPSPAYGPLDLAAIATVSQSTTTGTNTAALAIDSNASTVSETNDVIDSYWLLKLDRDRPVSRVELVNRADANATRMGGLTLRLLDALSVTIATTTVTNPGTGATWGFDVPPGTANARYLRIGLENGAVNGQGNRIVTLAGVSVFSGINYALGTPAYMVRLHDGLPAAALANDGNYATHTETTTQTTDGYWETDLGTVRSLYCVRAVAFDSGADQVRLAHATLRLFDANHESVYSEHLSGTSAIFDIALPGPVSARYVRVGFENKERSNPSYEWYLRLREVQAFGRPLGETGLTGLAAAATQIDPGQSTTLTWREEDLRDLTLYPGGSSAGSYVNAEGTGSLLVSPAYSTEYIMIGTNHNGPVARYATVLVAGQPLPVRINEFMASNRLSQRDGYRNPEDWIELHNPNDTPLDLTGYGLSDNPILPLKWVFPAGSTIPAHGYRIVFASGKASGIDPAGYLHADFNLSAAGESIVLTAPDGTTTVDSILNYPPQLEDLAYGRSMAGDWAFLAPTPAALNLTAALSGWLSPPTFSHSRGFYDTGFALTLTNPNPDAELLYSLNGTEPSLTYSGPIPVTGSLTVRAAVRRSGYQAPRVQTNTYIFRDSVMASPLMNTTYTQGALATRLRNSLTQLPSICVSVPVLSGDYTEREASIEVFLPDGTPPIQLNAGFTRFGGSWTDFAKRSYRLSFRPEYGTRNMNTPLLRGFDHGMPVLDQLDTLDLTAGNHDMAQRGFYMANRFFEDTMLEMGSLNPHGRFVHVYVNGTYWGQYNAHERLEDSFLAGYLGGATEDYVNVRGNDNNGSAFITGTPEPPNRELWEAVRANKGSYAAVKGSVDVPNLIDFMLLWFYGNCESEFRCAGPIAPGTGFKFWEADADGFLRTSALTLDTTTTAGPGGIFGALTAEGHPDFKTLLADRIYQHFFNNGALTPDRNLARLNTRMAEIQDSLIAECARWGFRTPDNWQAAAQTIRTDLFPQRTANLLAMLKTRGFYPAIEPPVLSKFGGSVPEGYQLTFTSGAGTIYYTLDGSDPRLPGGGIAPGARSTGTGQTNPVTTASVWKYWDKGSLPAANWQTAAYADTAWSSGTAPLGYGGFQTTPISYGSNNINKYITSYFRKTFTVADPAAVTAVNIGLVRDDGAVIYLNGVEVARSNMTPTGTIGYSTFASGAISGDANKLLVNQLSIPPNRLVAGTNLIAVEVHQSSVTSSDQLFDLSLTTVASASITLSQNTNLRARLLNGGTWSAVADATFHVAHPLLGGGPYLCKQWDANAAAGTYPQAMRLFQTDVIDPPLTADVATPWTLPYNLTSRSRINGLGTDGMAFINTGNVQTTPGAGFVGAAVVALDTTGTQDIRVTWTGGTVVPNDRDYGIRLQYRVGDTGTFLDVAGPGGGPVEYLRNPLAGHTQVIGPVALPVAAENRALVQVRWKYYFRSGITGSRAQLRLDDIQITAGPVAPESLVLLEFPVTAQAGSLSRPVVVQARGRNGAIAEEFTGAVTISLVGQPGLLGGTLTRQAVKGLAVFDDLVFPQPGVFTVTVAAAGLTGATSTVPTQVLGLSEIVMPRFIQGEQPENNQRVPFACLLRLEGLTPNATYRYANQLVNDDDPPTLEGAGNMIFTGSSFIRTTDSPRFLPADLNVRHGEFVADATGRHTGWFVSEPTGNDRFTPGATVHVRLLLNDGGGGDLAAHFLTASGPVAVMAFGTEAGAGSALYGESAAAPRNFMVLYEDTAGATRPLAATPVEATGMAVDSRYAAFYQSLVAGQPGRWGTIIPTDLTAGVRRIEERDLATGNVVSVFTSPDGNRPTTALATGSVPMGLRVPLTGASGFVRWQNSRFSLAELNDPAVGGAMGDLDHDGTTNLLEYAFGMDPFVPATEGLPRAIMEMIEGTPQLVFRYRRLTGDPGLSYGVGVSSAMNQWQDAAAVWTTPPEAQPDPGGQTETVTCRMTVAPTSPVRFFRVQVAAP
jgi:hypothetical protein